MPNEPNLAQAVRHSALLEAELGEALLAELSERLEPARLVVDNPLTRIATAVTILLRDLAAAPTQARLAARAVVTLPDVAEAVQARLRADLTEAQLAGMLAVGSVDLAARIVVALVEQASWLFSAGRIEATAVPDIVRAILRALGCPVDEAAERTDEAASNADAFAKRTSAAASKGPSA